MLRYSYKLNNISRQDNIYCLMTKIYWEISARVNTKTWTDYLKWSSGRQNILYLNFIICLFYIVCMQLMALLSLSIYDLSKSVQSRHSCPIKSYQLYYITTNTPVITKSLFLKIIQTYIHHKTHHLSTSLIIFTNLCVKLVHPPLLIV